MLDSLSSPAPTHHRPLSPRLDHEYNLQRRLDLEAYLKSLVKLPNLLPTSATLRSFLQVSTVLSEQRFLVEEEAFAHYLATSVITYRGGEEDDEEEDYEQDRERERELGEVRDQQQAATKGASGADPKVRLLAFTD